MSRSGWLERDLIGDTSAHESATRLWLVSAAKMAIRSRRAAGFSALAVLAAYMSSCCAFLLLVPVMYALTFTIALLHGRTRRDAFGDAHALPIDLPRPHAFSDEGARRLIERLERVRWAIESAALSGPTGRAFALVGLIKEVPQMERDVAVLAARVEYLARFLGSATSTGLRAELLRLEQDGEKERDAATRDALRRAARRCQEHLDTLQTLTARRAAALSTADDVLRTLEQVPARIVSLQLARIESCDVRSADVHRRTDAIIQGFVALEEVTRGPAATALSDGDRGADATA